MSTHRAFLLPKMRVFARLQLALEQSPLQAAEFVTELQAPSEQEITLNECHYQLGDEVCGRCYQCIMLSYVGQATGCVPVKDCN